ncbi:hypothetical protein AFCDBAGC_1701 [Methylobacterium cerastii]|uniref:DUF4435 domain-containing protein n=1 Tax=Methylobacterium cerastii TaxID=932741 RepID=A0ABQ4QF20_9HYPH|nr:hypothetical protein [Methylobacterium cerastii]GJD43842.1 hypothetical protein AFCDBAGC_1701 [Methylobacterium cerastii]
MLKRTVAEWVTIAKISRETGHLFFEGVSDARVIQHASGYPPNIDFRSSDQIEYDTSEGTSFLGGNKLRLVALSVASNRANCANIKCVIDGDFAIFTSLSDRNGCLTQTKFANLPVHSLEIGWLQGFFLKGYGYVIDSAKWDFIIQTLKFAFCARYYSANLKNPVAAPNVADHIKLQNKIAVFDNLSYLRAYFNCTLQGAAELCSQVQEYVGMIHSDIRNCVNSNDLFDIIYKLLKLNGKIGGSVPASAIRQAYFSAIDDNVLRGKDFSELHGWISLYASR